MKYYSFYMTADLLSLITAQNRWKMAKILSLSTIHNLSRSVDVCVQVYYHHKSMHIAAKVPKRKCYLEKLGINVENDEPHIHLNKFCQSCHTKAGQYSEADCSTLEVFEWTAYVDPSSSCKVCCSLIRKVLGEGQRRRK